MEKKEWHPAVPRPNTDRNKKVYQSYKKLKSLQRVADEFGISRQRVSQILSRIRLNKATR